MAAHHIGCLVAVVVILIALIAPPSTLAAVVARSKRSSYDFTCVRYCHSKCYMWQGHDLKHCASMCMEAGGIQNFRSDFCFNILKRGDGNSAVYGRDYRSAQARRSSEDGYEYGGDIRPNSYSMFD